MDKRISDRLASLFAIIPAVVFYWQGRELAPESVLFPQVLEAFLIVMGLYLLGRSFTGADVKTDDEHLAYNRAWIMIGATVAYLIGMDVIGFYVSTSVFLIAVSWFFNDHGFTARSFAKSVLFGLVMTVSIYAAFGLFLQVPTPEGILF